MKEGALVKNNDCVVGSVEFYSGRNSQNTWSRIIHL